jgi:signal transduction histidine kinase
MNFSRLISERLTASTVLSPAVFFIMLAWNVVVNLLDVANMNPALMPLRLFALTTVHILHWGLIWFADKVWKVSGRQLKGFSLIAVLVALSIARGFTLQQAFYLIGMNPLVEIWVRLAFSILYVGLGTAVVAIWVQQIRHHNKLMSDIVAEQERLNQVRFKAESRILEANQKLIAEIQGDLLSRVNRLSESNPLGSLAELQNAIDHVVRPMSEQLAYKESDWQPEPVIAKRVKVSWRRVVAESFYIGNMHSLAVSLITMALIAPSSIQLLGLIGALPPLLIAGTFHAIYLWLYQRQANRRLHGSSRRIQRIAVLAGYASAGLLSTLVARVLVNPNIPNPLLPLQIFVFTVVIGVAVCLVSQSLLAMNSVQRELAEATAQSSWEITRIRQLHRELERGLANKLHGKIQATLAASYLKLARAITEGHESESQLSGYKATLVRNILELQSEVHRPVRLQSVIFETVATWADVCRIQYHLPQEQLALIERDSLLCHALEDVIPELAFNSVKHGKASTLHFGFEIIDEKTLKLEAIDSGRQTVESGRVGLGSKLLDECCISWNRTTSNDGTTTSCLLPLKVSA